MCVCVCGFDGFDLVFRLVFFFFFWEICGFGLVFLVRFYLGGFDLV